MVNGKSKKDDYEDDDDEDDEFIEICAVCKKSTNVNEDGVCPKCAPLFYGGLEDDPTFGNLPPE